MKTPFWYHHYLFACRMLKRQPNSVNCMPKFQRWFTQESLETSWSEDHWKEILNVYIWTLFKSLATIPLNHETLWPKQKMGCREVRIAYHFFSKEIGTISIDQGAQNDLNRVPQHCNPSSCNEAGWTQQRLWIHTYLCTCTYHAQMAVWKVL